MRYGISAAALIVREGRLLLVHHWVAGRFDFWLPPGGWLEGDESILNCARRETWEETGLKFEPEHILYIQEFTEPGYHFVKFFILGQANPGELTIDNRDKDEDWLVDARFFRPEEMDGLTIHPAILQDRFWQDLDMQPLPTRYLGLEEIREGVMAYDLLIKNAQTRFSPQILMDIGIRAGRVEAIGEGLDGQAGPVIDAAGKLVTESFINGHLHLCKVYTLDMAGQEALSSYSGGSMGAAMTAIEQAARVKERYDESWIIKNVRRALRLALKFGNTHIRAFADTDTKARLEGVKALLRAREEFKGRVELQVVAFPQDGVVRDPGAEDYVRQAMELGADVVGGIPWIEYTDADAQEHIDRMFAIAKEYGKDVSMLIDDAGDPGLRTLEMLAVKTLQEGWQGRVTAQHARAMALYPEPYYRKVEALLKKARIGIVSDPQTGPLFARVRDLYQAGIGIALGQDDIADAYYPFGRNNMLEVAFLAAHLMWMNSFSDMDILYDLITTRAAMALGIEGFGLEVGNRANLVVLNAESVWEALLSHEAPLVVIKDGRDVTFRE